MSKIIRKQPFVVFVVLFFILNIINTYFLTVQQLNKYIAPFKHEVLGEINAFFGNLSILILLYLLISLSSKDLKKRMKLIIIASLLLNLFVFLLGIFNLFYGTAFSREALTIFYNPAGGIAKGMFTQLMYELFLYYRILVFLPTIVLSIAYFVIKKKNQTLDFGVIYPNGLKSYFIVFLSFGVMFGGSLFGFDRLYTRSTLPVQSVTSTYAIQNFGVYPFYLANLLGSDFDKTTINQLDIETNEALRDAYQAYNKNVSAYVNALDGKLYGNKVHVNDVNGLTYIDPSLLDGTLVSGAFKGKNVVLVHLETINHFLLEIPETNERFKFLNALLEESYVFSNYYTTVGMGVSADAEVSVLTGLYPNGLSTLHWDYNTVKYDLDTLPALFNLKHYESLAIHGDYGRFYNRNKVYYNSEDVNLSLMKFNNPYYDLEAFLVDYPNILETGYVVDEENNIVHKSPWISDLMLAETIYEKGNAFNKPFMLFPITMMPHTPFEYNPFTYTIDSYDKWINGSTPISSLTTKYINYVDYIDLFLHRMFIAEDGTNRTLDNTVYVFYSDHGSGIKNGDLDILFGRELEKMEERKILQQGLAFIYAPGSEIKDGDYPIYKGLLTGNQTLVRSHVDLYRTIVDLFDIAQNDTIYFGAHGLSKEPTFALDNRILDIIIDDLKGGSYIISSRNLDHYYPNDVVLDEELLKHIVRFKRLNDVIYTDAKMFQKIKLVLSNS